MTDFVALSYALVITVLVLVAIYAIIYPTMIVPRFYAKESAALQDLEGFLTAKKSQNMWRIGFSFFAGSVGSWAICTPPNYACFAGWIGLVFYALACGLPILAIAFFGHVVRDKYPTAGALGDVIVMRFGPSMRLCTCVVALFNMAIFLLAEFTTIGALFQDFVGSLNYPIIIVMAVITTAYATYGGLLVSIVTDQIQAIVTLILVIVLSIYVWATFKQPLPTGFGDLAPTLGPNESGYGAIFVMPVSLLAATIFNEGMWQRVWAAEDERALKRGSLIGCIAIVVCVFLFGLFGFLAAWGGLIDFTNTNINLYLFQIFKKDPAEEVNSRVDNAIEVVTLILALIMSESAIDSLQNAIGCTLTSTFLPRGYSIWWARAMVLVINIIIVPFALANYNVLSLFLSANMLGCCWFLPILVGGLWDSKIGRKVFSETTCVLGSFSAIILVTIYGIVDGPGQCASLAEKGAIWEPYHDICHCATPKQLANVALNVTAGINCAAAGTRWAWVGNPYMWQYFVFVTFVSLGVTILYGLISLALPDSLPGISDLLCLSHMRHIAEGSPADTDTIDDISTPTKPREAQQPVNVDVALPIFPGVGTIYYGPVSNNVPFGQYPPPVFGSTTVYGAPEACGVPGYPNGVQSSHYPIVPMAPSSPHGITQQSFVGYA